MRGDSSTGTDVTVVETAPSLRHTVRPVMSAACNVIFSVPATNWREKIVNCWCDVRRLPPLRSTAAAAAAAAAAVVRWSVWHTLAGRANVGAMRNMVV